jgi:hypothetical protein
MMMERDLKILMTGGLAVLCALIAIGNINDPDLNLEGYVRSLGRGSGVTEGDLT